MKTISHIVVHNPPKRKNASMHVHTMLTSFVLYTARTLHVIAAALSGRAVTTTRRPYLPLRTSTAGHLLDMLGVLCNSSKAMTSDTHRFIPASGRRR